MTQVTMCSRCEAAHRSADDECPPDRCRECGYVEGQEQEADLGYRADLLAEQWVGGNREAVVREILDAERLGPAAVAALAAAVALALHGAPGGQDDRFVDRLMEVASP